MIISRQLEIRRFSIHNDATLLPAVIDVNLTHGPHLAHLPLRRCVASWLLSHRHKWTLNFQSATMRLVDLAASRESPASTPVAEVNPRSSTSRSTERPAVDRYKGGPAPTAGAWSTDLIRWEGQPPLRRSAGYVRTRGGLEVDVLRPL